MKRGSAGGHYSIGSEQALDEIAAKLREIIDRHGPRAVALYSGTAIVSFFPMATIAGAFMKSIGSPMRFSANTIDKPGAQIAQAAHGTWQGGSPPFEAAEAWILIGLNPVISKSGGFPPNNPARRLKEAVARGMKLIVIDPRATESTARAHIHLQSKPGTDPQLLAAMIRVILAEGLADSDFILENVQGVEELRKAVHPFSPEAVAVEAGVSADNIVEAARVFAQSRYAGIGLGVGPSFSLHGGLTDYLATCMISLCGFWSRAGDVVQRPHVLLPPYKAKAQASPPFKGWGIGPQMRVRGLTGSAAGMPTAALSEEILLEGEGQVRALIVLAGNPLMAWPDQLLAHKALSSLELLVTTGYEMSSTAKLSHYVIAPKLTLEIDGDSSELEFVKYNGLLRGIEGPYGRYAPAIVPPPEGSDLIEDWELFYELAKRLGLGLTISTSYGLMDHAHLPPNSVTLDMTVKPTSSELLEMLYANSRVPLSEVKNHPHGAMFDVEERVYPRDADCTARLDVGNPLMLEELSEIASAPVTAELDFPYLMICRRINNIMNSLGRSNPQLLSRTPYNPAYLHPDDMVALGATEGDVISLESKFGSVKAIIMADGDLRRGTVSITHSFGGLPGEDDDPSVMGCNIGRLLSTTAEFDPITGIPRMSALPVRVTVGL
nr:molybdopterin-dependent oxidoreductase [Sphingobium chlorophenolicum]